MQLVKGGPGSGRHFETESGNPLLHRHPGYGENKDAGFFHPLEQVHNDPETLKAHIAELEERLRGHPAYEKRVRAALEEAKAYARGVPKEIEKSALAILNRLVKGGPGSGARKKEMSEHPDYHRHWGFDFFHPIEREHRDIATYNAHVAELRMRARTHPELAEKIKTLIGEEVPKEAPEKKPEGTKPSEEELRELRELRERAKKEAREITEEDLIDRETQKIMTREHIPYSVARPIAEKFHPRPEELGPEWTSEEEAQAIMEERFPGYHSSRPAPWYVEQGVAVVEGEVKPKGTGYIIPRTVFSNKMSGKKFQAELQIVQAPDGKFHVGPLDKDAWGTFDKERSAREFVRHVYEEERLPESGSEAANLANKWLGGKFMTSVEEEHREEAERAKRAEERIKETPEEREERIRVAREEAEAEAEARRKRAERTAAGRDLTELERKVKEAEAALGRAKKAGVTGEELKIVEERLKKVTEDKNKTKRRVERLTEEAEEARERYLRHLRAEEAGKEKERKEELEEELERERRRVGWTPTEKADKELERANVLRHKEQEPIVYSIDDLLEVDECFVYDAAALLPHVIGEEVLELGSGRGRFLDILRSSGYDATGIDNDRDNILICTARGHNVFEYDLEKGLPFDEGTFDNVVSSHTLEHINNAQEIAESSFRVARLSAAHLIPLGKRQCGEHVHEFESLNDVKEMFEGWEVEEVKETNCAIIFKHHEGVEKKFPTPLDLIRRRRERFEGGGIEILEGPEQVVRSISERKTSC
jgi:2-polyprenyl-3-methyl-5-hydroxy-6-metoxy-1,4-benzoquinol methylase